VEEECPATYVGPEMDGSNMSKQSHVTLDIVRFEKKCNHSRAPEHSYGGYFNDEIITRMINSQIVKQIDGSRKMRLMRGFLTIARVIQPSRSLTPKLGGGKESLPMSPRRG
jgi:hypothetical protein